MVREEDWRSCQSGAAEVPRSKKRKEKSVGIVIGKSADDGEQNDVKVEGEAPMFHIVKVKSCKPPPSPLHCGGQ
jgi:hypothetical protein